MATVTNASQHLNTQEQIALLTRAHETLCDLLRCEGASYFIDRMYGENWCLCEVLKIQGEDLAVLPEIAFEYSKPPFFKSKDQVLRALDVVGKDRIIEYLSI